MFVKRCRIRKSMAGPSRSLTRAPMPGVSSPARLAIGNAGWRDPQHRSTQPGTRETFDVLCPGALLQNRGTQSWPTINFPSSQSPRPSADIPTKTLLKRCQLDDHSRGHERGCRSTALLCRLRATTTLTREGSKRQQMANGRMQELLQKAAEGEEKRQAEELIESQIKILSAA